MRLRKILLILTVWIGCSLPVAVAQQIIETDALGSFAAVTLNGPLKVELVPARENRISITLLDIDSRHVEWHVKDNTLTVNARKGVVNRQGVVEIKLFYTGLSRISSKGAEVTTAAPIVTPTLLVEAQSSSGRMELSVETEEITVHTSGSNRIRLHGTTDHAFYQAKLGSRIEAIGMPADRVTATATGKAEIQLWSDEFLDATAQTGGNIFYSGDPSVVLTKKGLAGGIEPVRPQTAE